MWYDKLKQARLEKGLSQKQAAELAGVNVRQWQFYESGERVPSLLIAKELARAVGVSLDWLTSD